MVKEAHLIASPHLGFYFKVLPTFWSWKEQVCTLRCLTKFWAEVYLPKIRTLACSNHYLLAVLLLSSDAQLLEGSLVSRSVVHCSWKPMRGSLVLSAEKELQTILSNVLYIAKHDPELPLVPSSFICETQSQRHWDSCRWINCSNWGCIRGCLLGNLVSCCSQIMKQHEQDLTAGNRICSMFVSSGAALNVWLPCLISNQGIASREWCSNFHVPVHSDLLFWDALNDQQWFAKEL